MGTANLNLNSEISWLYNDLELISPDGITRSFDEAGKMFLFFLTEPKIKFNYNLANGYGRSDGVVVLYITKANLAKRSYCTILNVMSEYNGNRDGPYLRHDSGSIVDFMKKFYTKSGVDPSSVEYLETYGCGLPVYTIHLTNKIYSNYLPL